MIAIIKSGGKQYTVKAGQILKVEKIIGKKGENISLKNVLALSDSTNHTLGNPLVKDASVEAKIIEQIRDKKIIVFKKRKRQNYRSTQGHRQYLTVLKIESIKHGSKKTSVAKDESNKKLENNQTKKSVKNVAKKTITKKKNTSKTVKKKIAIKKNSISKK